MTIVKKQQKQEPEASNKQKYSSTNNRVFPTLMNKEQLNTIVTNKDGSPDYLAINIYYDTFRSWYNPKTGYNKDGNVYHINKLKTPLLVIFALGIAFVAYSYFFTGKSVKIFPMIFYQSYFIGGSEDLEKFIKNNNNIFEYNP